VERGYQTRLEADAGAHYAVELELDLASVVPHVSGPDHVKVMHAVPEIEKQRVKINKAYLLSCVNARLEDLAEAARVVDGQTVAEGVEFYVAAASSNVQADAEADGIWDTLQRSGARFLPPGCGTCIGLGAGTLQAGEVGISATNRNFKGRMGSRDAKAYLASPAVVAASALAGYICSPEPFDSEVPRTRSTVHGPRPRGGRSTSIIEGFPRQLSGRVLWLPMDNLNTDGIYSGKLTYRDDVSEADMAAAAMENYDPNFGSLAQSGDVIVSGHNFGTGSSREQAATCLKLRGIQAIIAASFSQTYVRNAINNGFLCLASPGLVEFLRSTHASDQILTVPLGDCEIDFEQSTVTLEKAVFDFTPLGKVPQEIILAGGAESVIRNRIA
jgi:homoaconitate hydratase